MKRCLLQLSTYIILLAVFIFSSCKNVTHYPHPSSGHMRISSYSTVGTVTQTIPTYTVTAENDNYSFGYDALNRVSYIIFTCNNPAKYNTNSYFNYSNDTIYKSVYATKPTLLLELDTFVLNQNGLIGVAYVPGFTTTFQYYENLLTIMQQTNEATGAVTKNTYTSIVGNWLENTSSLGASYTQDYTYYTDYTNRPGDYMQIGSFTMYGANVYPYASMVRSITQANGTVTTARYNIDANSNVLNTIAQTVDLSGHSDSVSYNFQYENY